MHHLRALGYFAAHLDFRLVEWLHRERESAGRVDNFINALKNLHADFSWPYPVVSQPLSSLLQRKMSSSVSGGMMFALMMQIKPIVVVLIMWFFNPVSNLSNDKNPTFSATANNDINSAVGDSGYMSCQDYVPLRPQDIQMQPHVCGKTQSLLIVLVIRNVSLAALFCRRT